MARANRPARIRVGTSGFSHARWRGLFYPRDLPPGDMLRHYSTLLDCVEIGSTATHPLTDRLATSWRRETPAEFAIVLKAPQRVTHEHRLDDARAALHEFARCCAPLGSKLAALLFQLPPHLPADPTRLDAFLGGLPRGPAAIVDARHESWFDERVYAVLRRRRATLCVTDTHDGTTPMVATAPLGYIRLRRDDYDDAALADWVARVRSEPGWRRAFVFVKHDQLGQAGVLARRLRSLSDASAA